MKQHNKAPSNEIGTTQNRRYKSKPKKIIWHTTPTYITTPYKHNTISTTAKKHTSSKQTNKTRSRPRTTFETSHEARRRRFFSYNFFYGIFSQFEYDW